MRRLKVNKKSLLKKGGTPAPKMTMDTDSILQGIREKLQGGVSEVEVFQNLMEQEIPLDEIQTAFTSLGYDETMLSNIMQAIQQSAVVKEEPIGEVQGSELPQAQFGITDLAALSPGNFGNPAFRGTISTGNIDPTSGYRPARGTYLQQDLFNQGNLAGAIGVLAEGANRLFSGEDLNNDGVMDGAFRDGKAKRKRHKDRRGGYYDYEIEYDENDPNQGNYNLNYQDLYKGKLRTNEQYGQDILDNSMLNYNVDTGQYDVMISADKIRANRFSNSDKIAGNKDDVKNFLGNSVSFAEFQQRLKDNPAHAELIAQDLGLIKDDKLPAGVSYGVDKDGAAASYLENNPYLYDTMMANNVFKGEASKDYQLSDFNLQGTSLRSGNTNTPTNDPPSNNPPSSNVDYSYLDPTLNTMFDFEQTSGGFDKTTGKAYGLSNLGANRYTSLKTTDPDYLDPKDPNFRANLTERVKRDYGSSLQGFDQSLQPAMLDFAYNTGRDPRIYLLDQYIKSQGNTAGLDNRGTYKDAMKDFSWTDANLQKNFDQVYGDNAAAISALPVEDQIKLMNQGRQFYYNNINMVNNQPNPAAAATWLQRPFYKKQGGSLPEAQFGFDLKGYFSGEQGLIPDYKGESTTKTVNKAVDKYGDAVGTGLDIVQTGMTAAGMVPVVGNVVDLVNTGVSGVRAGVAGAMGDTDAAVKHTENMAINAASAIPGVGIGIGGAGLVKDVAGYTGLTDNKSIASNIGIQTERPSDPGFESTPITQALGVGDQRNTKTTASKGYELPAYQRAGETDKVPVELGSEEFSPARNQINNQPAKSTIYDFIREGDLPKIESEVNNMLGGTMNRGAQISDIPGYKRYEEAKNRFYTSDKYQNLIKELNSEYGKDEVNEDKVDEINIKINNLENTFNESQIAKMGEGMERFFYNNEDPLRHGTTSGLTAKAISDKIKNVPYIGGLLDFVGADDMGGVIGANLLGLGHEASAYMDYGKNDGRSLTTQIKESGKDMYNNFLGSLASIGADSDEEVAKRVIDGVKEGNYTSGVVNELPKEQNAGETNKERKKRIKEYDHPYLQQYIEEFKSNNKGDETAVKDIMSQMGVTGADTLLLGSSQNLGMAKRMANFDLLQHIANEINPDGGQTTVTYKDRIPFNTGPVDDDGNSYNMDQKTWYNDDGGYLHTIKSLLNAKKPLEEKQDGGANTLYEYYTGMGQDLPSIPERGTIYQDANLGQQYSGTAAQNTQLLEYLQDPANATVPDDQIQQNIELDEFTITAPGGVSTLEPTGVQPIEVDPPDMQLKGVNEDGTITQTEPNVPPSEDPDFKGPKVKRKNKVAGRIQQFMDSPGMEKFGAASEFAVAGTNVVNEYFKDKNKNIALNEITNKKTTDDVYGMQLAGADGSRGLVDEKTGIVQPDNIIAYEAQMGRETFMMPPMKQQENIVDLDYQTVAKLISAGADIEIL